MLSNFKDVLKTLNLDNIENNNLHVDGVLSRIFTKGIPRGKIIHLYGDQNAGKTHCALSLIYENSNKVCLYISNKLDDFAKMNHINNCHIFISNIFEEVIEYLNQIPKGLVDVIILDGINNMACEKEFNNGFKLGSTQKIEFEKFLKDFSFQMIRMNAVGFIINGKNQMNDKPKYDYLVEKYSSAKISIKKKKETHIYSEINLKVMKNHLCEIECDEANIILLRQIGSDNEWNANGD